MVDQVQVPKKGDGITDCCFRSGHVAGQVFEKDRIAVALGDINKPKALIDIVKTGPLGDKKLGCKRITHQLS